ncbi:MAG TPA: hypothetical protein VNS02_09705 [Rhizobiaceae bacterium]|nr:hypothetical protein [Rhizobiaceae bacterium]
MAASFVVAISLFVLSAGEITGTHGWTANIVRERELAVSRSQPNRLVIVAGSGGLFGIAAVELSRRTGRPAVNASSHAALRFDMLDYYFLQRLVRGDVLLLPLEFQYYYDGPPQEMNTLSVAAAHAVGLGYFWSLPLAEKAEYLRLLDAGFLWMQLRSAVGVDRFEPVRGYWRYASHWNGDIDTWGGAAKPVEPMWVRSKVEPGAKSRICKTIRALVDRGVKVIGTPPNAYVSDQTRGAARSILSDASMMFRECGGSFISPAGDGFASEGDMLDTNFHLTARARMKRSELLADALCTVVECKP